MKNILLFGGTTEGRELAMFMEKRKIPCYVSVATEYGKEVLPSFQYCQVRNGRMNTEQMQAFITEHQIDLVLDATHPYAVDVTKNIQRVAQKNQINYQRIIREANEKTEQGIYFQSLESLIDYINEKPQITLVTTGSKELMHFKKVNQYEKYIYARVLPIHKIIEECCQNGFAKEHIIGMQGPFSVEQNINQLKGCHAGYLVTKDTGREGGFPEKCQAAKLLGVTLLIIERPVEEFGITLDRAKAYLAGFTD